MRGMGYISVVDGITLLQMGLPIYVVSAPVDTNALPLEGCWKDNEGRIHYDLSCITINPDTAHKIGRAYHQECILRLYPSHNAKGAVYLLKDVPLARQLALDCAGGYTADGEWLFTAVENDDDTPFEECYEEYVPAEVEFIPVK